MTHVQLETATRRSNITTADAIFVGKQVPDAGSWPTSNIKAWSTMYRSVNKHIRSQVVCKGLHRLLLKIFHL